MNVYDSVSRVLPCGTGKEVLRRIFYDLSYRFTVGTYPLTICGQTARFRRPLFVADFDETDSPADYFRDYVPGAGDVVIDAGAFHGHFAVIASKLVGAAGRVICFEPDPENARLLKRNLSLNRCTNVVIVRKGLGGEAGRLAVFAHGPGTHLGSLGARQSWAHRFVDVMRLDDVREELGLARVDMIKMDIEGAELDALRGAEQLLSTCATHLAIASYHVVDGRPTNDRAEQWLAAHGYAARTSDTSHRITYASRVASR